MLRPDLRLQHVSSLEQLEQHALNYHVNRSELPKTVWDAIPDDKPLSASEEAAALFDDLDFQLEPACVQKKESYWSVSCTSARTNGC